MRRAGVAVALCLLFAAAPAVAAESAVILMYHRFGEDAHPATNIRIATGIRAARP